MSYRPFVTVSDQKRLTLESMYQGEQLAKVKGVIKSVAEGRNVSEDEVIKAVEDEMNKLFEEGGSC